MERRNRENILCFFGAGAADSLLELVMCGGKGLMRRNTRRDIPGLAGAESDQGIEGNGDLMSVSVWCKRGFAIDGEILAVVAS
jgi:hypothetical protein